jgi:hypothetical protein
MIRVHKDVLDHLGIEHVFLTASQNAFCTLLEIGLSEKWLIAIGNSWEAEEAILNIKYRGTYLVWQVHITPKDKFSYHLELSNEEFKVSPLYGEIEELERNESLWNKRKEMRMPVGADLSGVLGLRKAEQKAVITGGQEMPCMVNDLSFGGMKITTYDTGSLKKGDPVLVLLDFTDPVEKIPLKGTIQVVTVKTGLQKTAGGHPVKFAIISIQFQGDPPLAFRQRLGAFMEKVG